MGIFDLSTNIDIHANKAQQEMRHVNAKAFDVHTYREFATHSKPDE